jgi:hypothetical protein
MDAWIKGITTHIPPKDIQRGKRRYYPRKPREPFTIVSRLRLLRASVRNAIAYTPELSQELELLRTTLAPGLLPSPIPQGPTWPILATSECSTLLAASYSRSRGDRTRAIKTRINSRFAQYLMALEEGVGLSAYYRRANWSGMAKLKHCQIDLPNDGASTDPDKILERIRGTLVEWFAARKGALVDPHNLPPHIAPL